MLPVLAALASLGLLLGACSPAPMPTLAPNSTPATASVRVVVETQLVTVESVVTATPAPPPSRQLTVCFLQEPPSLNPFVSDLPAARAAREALFDGLIDSRNYQHHAVALQRLPSLLNGDAVLETVEVSLGDIVFDTASGQAVTLEPGARVTLLQADGTAVEADFSVISTTTALRLAAQWTQADGLAWEDGVPVTSQDALLAFEVARSPRALLRPDFALFAAEYTYVDDHTVRWVGLPGYADDTFFLNHAGFLPAHIYAGLTPDEILDDPRANHHPLAYGPFRLDEWASGEYMRFSPNPFYWRAAEGLPRLDSLTIRFVPDTAQVVAQVASGRCDLALNDSALSEQFPVIQQLEVEGLLAVHMLPDTAFDQLSFNALPVPGVEGFSAVARASDGGPVFSDARVRQAFAHCLDRQAIIAQGLGGVGLLQHTYAPPNHPLYAGDEQVTRYDFDPALGLALLDAAGWRDSDGDGRLDNGQGQAFAFVLTSRDSALRQVVTRLVGQQLRDNCQIEPIVLLLGSEYTEPGPAGLALGRRYDVSQLTFRHGGEPLCSLYLGSAIPDEANGWLALNITGYNNPDFDQACQAALQAVDPAEKLAWHVEAQQIWSADLPAIILYAPVQLMIARPGLANLLPDSTAASALWNVERIDLDH